MLKRTLGFLAVMFLAFGLTSLGSPAYAVEDKDCGDFTTQEEAQAAMGSTDPHGLDRDGDGIACETLPNGGGGTESGTLPETGVNPLVLVIGSVTLLASGGIFLVASRVARRRTN